MRGQRFTACGPTEELELTGRNHEDDLHRFSGSLGPVPGMALQHPAAVGENAGRDHLAKIQSVLMGILVVVIVFMFLFGWKMG